MSTITKIAVGNGNFSVLVAALQYVDSTVPGSNLVNTLNDASGDFTVFAPTDAAFGQLASDLGFAGDTSDTGAVTTFLVDNLPATTIRDVLIYHVSAGGQTLADINASGTVDTLLGVSLTSDGPTLVDGEPDLIDPSIVIPDITADNGVVHAIDRVLLPIDLPGNDVPSIAEIVAASGGEFDSNNADFDLLLQAAQTANLVGALADPNADLTVFAPNDAAFIALSQTLGFQGSDEQGAWNYLVEALTLLGGGNPIPLLTQVLLYHVSGESLQASQVLSADQIATLQGGSLGVDGASLVDADPDLSNPNIIATDIQANNGIVHIIDGVLIPADLLVSNGANDVDFVIAGDNRDYIHTGADNDFIDGNGGNDFIAAGSGNDVVFGGTGDDRIYGSSGSDLILGEDGDDFIFGGSHDDSIDGGAGSDRIWAGSGNDVVAGGDGNDLISGYRGHDVIDGGQGHDYIYGGLGNDDLSGGSGNDRIVGSHGHDDITGGSGRDYLYGGSGNDNVMGGGGRDRLFGSSGHDTLDGDSGNDYLWGGSGSDQINGGSGDDYLSGSWGNDTLEGGTGNDHLSGGTGADTFVFNQGDGHDTIARFSSNDTIDLSSYGFDGFEDIEHGITGNWFTTHIDLGSDSITLYWTNPNSITESDFIF